MRRWTSPDERRRFFERHLRGETYRDIADSDGVSCECVRYWCRRQRDGGSSQSAYRRGNGLGALVTFHPLVRYGVLRLRLEHPRWGANRILAGLQRRSSVRGLLLPSQQSISRYLFQWRWFRRQPKKRQSRERPKQPTEVHQRWQMDFKLDIRLADGTRANLLTVRDPVGEACLGAYLFEAQVVHSRVERVSLDQIRSALRRCFTDWGLPDEIHTDGEGVWVGQPGDSFPSPFTLWLAGLGIRHLVIRPYRPTDNAEVERCHRLLSDYALVGHRAESVRELQAILDEAVHDHLYTLTSRATGCRNRPPAQAHPELFRRRRSFQPDWELACFELQRVDNYLATFTWERRVNKTGQIGLGGQHTYYWVGRQFAGRVVYVRFDPADRSFVFFDTLEPLHEIGRRPARDLTREDILGWSTEHPSQVPQQLPLPWATAA